MRIIPDIPTCFERYPNANKGFSDKPFGHLENRRCLRYIATNAVGADKPDVKAEVHCVRLEPSDGIMLCFDGLTDMVRDEDIARILEKHSDPERAQAGKWYNEPMITAAKTM